MSAPLTYAPLKAVVKNFNLNKREQLDYKVPACRIINSKLPYHLESVHLADNFMKVNGREWSISKAYAGEDDDELFAQGEVDPEPVNVTGDEEKTGIRFQSKNYFFLHKIDKKPDVSFDQLFHEYLRNGTCIERLTMYTTPRCLTKNDPEKYKWNVAELKLRDSNFERFKELLPYIEHNDLNRIHFVMRQDTIQMLQIPLVKRSAEIFLQFPYYGPIPLNNLLEEIQNPFIHVIYFEFAMEKVQELAKSWKDSRRPLGNTFALVVEEYTYILEVFDLLEKELEAVPSKLSSLGPLYFSHSVTIPICDETELVVYGGPMLVHWPPFKWTLRMKVVKRGSSIAK